MVSLRSLLRNDVGGLLLLVLAASALMALLSPAFLTSYNLYVIGRDMAVTLLVALAQLVVLAVGQMNLSLGTLGGLVAVTTGGLMERAGLPVPLAIAAGLLLGLAGGVLNGVLIVRTQINSFIVTIATSSMFLGINYGMTEATPFYNLPADFKAFGQARWGFFPEIGVPTLVASVLMAIFLTRMVLGRQLLAVGGNARAAETSGIPVGRMVVLAHAISGLLAAIAGILLMARLGSAQPTIGADWLLISFAGPIIGGASLTGGAVSVGATALAVVLVTLIQNALVQLNADPYYVQFLLGLLILLAVGLQRLLRRQRAARPAPPVHAPESLPVPDKVT